MFDRSLDHVYLAGRSSLEGQMRDGREIGGLDSLEEGWPETEISARGLSFHSGVPMTLGAVIEVRLENVETGGDWQTQGVVVGCERFGRGHYRVTLLFLNALDALT